MANYNFKQIGPFINRASKQSNALHLNWMKQFTGRINSLIVEPLETDCPPMIAQEYDALAAAVVVEDDCYKIITRSTLTEQIAQADDQRDNTFMGMKTMVEALGRVGTAAQKEAAPHVLQAIRDYQVSTRDGYELESTRIEQLIQQLEIAPLATDCTTLGITALVSQLKTENQQVVDLISLRNEQQAGVDPAAMQTARKQVDELYVEMVMIVNAFAIAEQVDGESAYDHAIEVINEDEDYYIQHVFTKGKLKKLKIGDATITYAQGETWREAIEEHPEENEGWTVSLDDEVLYQAKRLLDEYDEPVSADAKVAEGEYSFEEPQPEE